MMQYQLRRFVCGFSCLLIGGFGSAYAEVLASEHFEYSGTSLSRQNGGTGWSGAWSSENAKLSNDGKSLSFAGRFTAGGRVKDVAVGSSQRQLATPLDFGKKATYYVSILVTKTEGGSADFGFSDGTSSRWRWRYNASGEITVGVSKSTDVSVGKYNNADTLLLVSKIETTAGNDTASLQVFKPGDTIAEPTTWDATAAAKSAIVANRFGFSGNVAGVQIDSIIIGTTFADVIPAESK